MGTLIPKHLQRIQRYVDTYIDIKTFAEDTEICGYIDIQAFTEDTEICEYIDIQTFTEDTEICGYIH